MGNYPMKIKIVWSKKPVGRDTRNFLDFTYARGNLSKAVEVLVSAYGDVRQRVAIAWGELGMLKATDFPPQLRKDWDWIVAQSTRYGPRRNADGTIGESSVGQTMRRIRCTTASKIAKKIWLLYGEMNHFLSCLDAAGDRGGGSVSKNVSKRRPL